MLRRRLQDEVDKDSAVIDSVFSFLNSDLVTGALAAATIIGLVQGTITYTRSKRRLIYYSSVGSTVVDRGFLPEGLLITVGSFTGNSLRREAWVIFNNSGQTLQGSTFVDLPSVDYGEDAILYDVRLHEGQGVGRAKLSVVSGRITITEPIVRDQEALIIVVFADRSSKNELSATTTQQAHLRRFDPSFWGFDVLVLPALGLSLAIPAFGSLFLLSAVMDTWDLGVIWILVILAIAATSAFGTVILFNRAPWKPISLRSFALVTRAIHWGINP